MTSQDARRVRPETVISRDQDVHSGDLVFAGTRVPVETLIDYLKGGESIDEFLRGFPSVQRWQVEAFLELTPEAVDRMRGHGASAA